MSKGCCCRAGTNLRRSCRFWNEGLAHGGMDPDKQGEPSEHGGSDVGRGDIELVEPGAGKSAEHLW